MNDTAFREDLRERRQARESLQGARAKIVAKMEAMVEAKRRELGEADDATVRAALERDPEWKSLYQRCLDANRAIEENQSATLAAVRRRIRPERPAKGKISK